MKVWVDGASPPPSDEWKWARTSQEGASFFLSKQVTEASFCLNFGDNSGMNGITFIRWLLNQAKAGFIPRFRWSMRGGVHWADVQKAPIVLQEMNAVWDVLDERKRKS